MTLNLTRWELTLSTDGLQPQECSQRQGLPGTMLPSPRAQQPCHGEVMAGLRLSGWSHGSVQLRDGFWHCWGPSIHRQVQGHMGSWRWSST